MRIVGIGGGTGLPVLLGGLKELNESGQGPIDITAIVTVSDSGGSTGALRRAFGMPAMGDIRNCLVSLAADDSILTSICQHRFQKPEGFAGHSLGNLQQQCDAAQARIVMVTSAAGGEGKSLTAINLAMALAATSDGSVLLIDADMRKPRVNEYLNLTIPAGKGFYNLLVNGEDKPENYVTKIKNLHVIPGSVPTANPVAALSSPKARALFERLKQEFTYIVVDAPPTLPIADSHILSGLSDKVLFVVRARSTPRELFQHAVEGFDATNMLGAVLNDVDYQRSRYAYAYEYYKKTA